MFKIAYCDFFSVGDTALCTEICKDFVEKVYEHFPEFKHKVKIHVLLHLVDSFKSFGPTSCYNTERYKLF